jgi:alpha-beta hydrolase superfamily lysophospholipase
MPIWIWVTGGQALAVFVAMDRFALATIRPPRKKHARTTANLPFRVREHSFTSLGQRLAGWFVEPEEDLGGAVAVLVHGWGSSHGRMTHLAEPLLKAGYPVFLFDVRRHGESYDAPYVTVRHFRDDIRAAVQEMRSAFPDRPLVLMGHSMGGSAAVLAVVEGAPVDALVTVGAPADLWGVWADYFDQLKLPGRVITRLLRPFWLYRAGEPFSTLSPDDRAREVKVPFLILHGDRDRSVSPDHASILAQRAGVDAVLLKGEGHNDLLGREPLHRKILGFMGEVVGNR